MRDYLDKVMKRAEEIGIMKDSRFNHLMDLTYANKAFNIDWKAWYESDDENFAHDFIGIWKNIDRGSISSKHKATEEDFNFFVPRFAFKNVGE